MYRTKPVHAPAGLCADKDCETIPLLKWRLDRYVLKTGRVSGVRRFAGASTTRSTARVSAGSQDPAVIEGTKEKKERRRIMKALVYHGTKDVSVDSVPDAKIEKPTDVVVKITTTNICGSDLHMYEAAPMSEREQSWVTKTSEGLKKLETQSIP